MVLFVNDPINTFGRYVHRVFTGTLLLILAVAGMFLLTGHKPWSRGVALGGSVSLVNLLIMAKEVRKQGPALGDRGMKPAYGGYALRMAATAAALIYSVTSSQIAFWATVPALFASQIIMTCGELSPKGK